MEKANKKLIRIGWREWLSLPELGIPAIKVKIDSGARTSALHAFKVKEILHGNVHKVQFSLHPLQGRTDFVLDCEAPIVDRREVCDSGGHREMRYVIKTPVRMGPMEWDIEITLSSRETMRFRMLLGRSAMSRRFVINPSASYLLGKELLQKYSHILGNTEKNI